MLNKIFYLDNNIKTVTGGHKYNNSFKQYLEDYSGINIVYTPNLGETYQGWKKVIAPFVELRWMLKFGKNSVVFFTDTAYKYLFLLALMCLTLKSTFKVTIVHHFSFNDLNGIKTKILLWIQKRYFSCMDAIIVPSPYTLDMAKKYYPKKQIFYIPLPFEKNFNTSETYQVGNLLYVGTIDERKGLAYLVDAMGIIKKENPEVQLHLDVVGKISDEAYHNSLIQQAQKLNVLNDIDFKGRISDTKLQECYAKAEIFSFPSLLEGYGIVLVEAMSNGLPIVAFNNTAMPYSIHDGINGLLAENKNAKSLAEKILLLTGNKSLRIKLQEGMRETMMNIKTEEDFRNGIRAFWDTLS